MRRAELLAIKSLSKSSLNRTRAKGGPADSEGQGAIAGLSGWGHPACV